MNLPNENSHLPNESLGRWFERLFGRFGDYMSMLYNTNCLKTTKYERICLVLSEI